VLVEHLLLNPRSRCRAIRYDGDLRWIGWDYTSEAMASLFDLVAAMAAGEKFTDEFRFARPGGRSTPVTDSPPEDLVAPTIADFNTGAFMSQVSG